MIIKTIKLNNFRNYGSLSLNLSPGINIFLGENAQGKTNILEAIYYSALSHSHRTNDDEDLIRQKSDQANMQIIYERLGIENEISINLFRQKRRQIFSGDQHLKVREMIGLINVVLFSPEDLFLIKGAPQGRRRFLDAEISQANPRYFNDLSTYIRLLNQRNSLLKRIRETGQGRDMLTVWDEQLADLAAKVVKKRLSSVKDLNNIAAAMQKKLSNDRENLLVAYEIKDKEINEFVEENLVLWYNKRLRDSIETDIYRGSTSIGPQRDDLIFSVNGNDLKSYGSQGQQRTGILALKLSELEFLHQETGEYPVLLLDDVMSELDSNRRIQLLEFISREKIQTLITATEPAYFPAEFLNDAYIVKEGHIDAKNR